MKSFWNALKKIGGVVLNVEHAVAPIVVNIDPALAPFVGVFEGWVNRVHGMVITAEANNPVDGQGQIKLQAVVADFEAGLSIANAIAGAKGKKIDYNHPKFNESVGHLVAFYNGMAEVKASFKEVDL